ncbi:DUF547 domain-containing protein [Lewinella sp. W8]|uniref:DUF547 domain-containing protein n=1 Tax=Lewinella sp. W8 TaxID=2528208 RepID=UPI001562F5F3|nr:DUF547 domain-containing protein [Lewinella sp. W8]
MSRFSFLVLLSFLLFVSCGRYQAAEDFSASDSTPDPNELSEEILRTIRAGQDATAMIDQLAAYEPSQLVAALQTREEKLAFWVNVYNGVVQHLLINDPSLYDDRSSFFSGDLFTVAGHTMSPNDLEHGIIRGGENRLGLGIIPQFFQNKFERTFKIKGGDSRIHFALNCGAADCPPVAVYSPETYHEQINESTRKYLAKHSEIKTEDGKEVLYTSPLFSWFRGDFADRGGIDDFLVEFGVVPAEKEDIKREYTDYDWTLKTGIWAE